LAVLLPVISSPARTVPDPTDAVGFFTTVADKLLRSTFSFGITNIPVLTNGVFVYTPAVQRLLQVTANLRDASTTNFYPTVYRPIFYRDPSGNVFITGYQQIAGVTGPNDPQLTAMWNLFALPFGVTSNVNVYGVPWIIGAKKYMPNFNAFYSYDTAQISRQLQVSRRMVEAYTIHTSGDFFTNQMLILSITNHIGYSFWNSYATNYPGGASTVVANDSVSMRLYQASSGYMYTFYAVMPQFIAPMTVWPGSQWNIGNNAGLPPGYQNPYAGSFVTNTCDFPFISLAALNLDQNGNLAGTGFVELNNFNTSITAIYPFPQLELDLTNWFQGFILDGTHVIDYVQFDGPSEVRNLGNDVSDPNFYSLAQGSLMWSTNASGPGSPPTGVNYGVYNQMRVSQTDQNVPTTASWISSPNYPRQLPQIPALGAEFFLAFFTEQPIIYDGIQYQNTNLVQQAPYTPIRTVTTPVVWLVNDPLVHYLSSDLTDPIPGLNNGIWKYDGSGSGNVPLQYPALNSVYQLVPLTERYQPWMQNAQMASLGYPQYDTNAYNLAYRDPLVYGSDDWNFPATNSLPLTTLGQVHRGTPWQTIYLKATNILDYVDATQLFNPAVGMNTWENWTGDYDTNDAALLSPTSDWRLAGLITALFNTNDATQLASANTSSANWPQLLDGIVTLTNSTPGIPDYYYPPELDAFVMTSSSPQAAFIAGAIPNAQANQPGRQFTSVGDLLSAPELSIASPWLNISDQNHLDYDISDAAYEAIPSQLLARLRPDSTGGIVFINGGWSVQFSGADGFDYAVQTSTDLVNWQNVCTNQPAQGVLNFPIAPATGGQPRFYRSLLLP